MSTNTNTKSSRPKNMYDSLGDRMKFYESENRQDVFPNSVPFVVRLDGKAFHSFRNFKKPFDVDFHLAMVKTTEFLMQESNTRLGYTQSDEISLVFYVDHYLSEYYFGGKRDKLNSILASMCSAYFNSIFSLNKLAYFDARSFWLPYNEIKNYLFWRVQDAERNSIQALGQSLFSSKKLHGQSCTNIIEMSQQAGIDWHTLPFNQKLGTFIDNAGHQFFFKDKSAFKDQFIIGDY